MSAVQVIQLNPLTQAQEAQLADIAATICELHAAGRTIDIAIGKQLAIAKDIWKAEPNELRRVDGWQGWVSANLPFGINKANDLINLAAALETDEATGLDVTHLHARAIRILMRNHVTPEQRRIAYELLQTGVPVNDKIAYVIAYAPTHVLDTWRSGKMSVEDAMTAAKAWPLLPEGLQVQCVTWGVVHAETMAWLVKPYNAYANGTDDTDLGYGIEGRYATLLHEQGYLTHDEQMIHISDANPTDLDNYTKWRQAQHIEWSNADLDSGDKEPPLWAGRLQVVVVDGKRAIVLPEEALDHIADYELSSVQVDVKVVWKGGVL